MSQDSCNSKNLHFLTEENFLAALHSEKFSEPTHDAVNALQIERRCLATKYMSAKIFDNEDMANFLLKKGLETYQEHMDDKAGVNNYWPQIEELISGQANDNLTWKSGLKDPKIALQFIKPVRCRTDNLLDCKSKEFADRHVKDIVSAWQDVEQSSRNRKVSAQRTTSQINTNSYGNNASGSHVVAQNHSLSGKGGYEKYHSTKPGWKDEVDSRDNSNFPNPWKAYDKQQTSYLQTKLNLRALNRNANPNKALGTVNNEEYQRDNRPTYLRHETAKTSSQEETDKSEYRRNDVPTFKSGMEELRVQQSKKNKGSLPKRTLAGKPPVNRQFICPIKQNEEEEEARNGAVNTGMEDCEDERLKNIDPKMIELIRNEIMDSGAPVSWDDIAGLQFAKNTIKEIIVFPLLRPDIFTGLRQPPKGILLFGPPGTGKTLIGKCIASQSKSTFFSISASSLTSKWIGEGEKMVRALFAVARVHQPAVVFIDEIDSLLTQRSETEHESSRRIKTEFLVQLDGAATAQEDRILVVGATNRPQELDEAARRRLVKRLYVPLPELDARIQIIQNLLRSERHSLSSEDISGIAKLAQGYSGADMTNLCKEASMGPIRSIPFDELENIKQDDVRGVTVADFENALTYVRPSVSQTDLTTYVAWDRTYGTGTAQNYGS